MSEIVVIIRPSFMKFCKDGCKAAIFNHILYWIAKKAKGQPQEAILSGEITYYATTDELAEQMAGAWGYQKVRKEVNDLIDMGIIGRGKNPTWGADRTKHFYFGKEQHGKLLELCQKHNIDLSKIGLSSEVTDLIKHFTNPSNAIDQSVKCPEHKQFTDMSNANDKYVRAITKDTTKDSKTKDTERKNDAPQQNPHVSTQDDSHSFVQSPSISSQETKGAVFPPESEQVYILADQLHITYLKRDEKHRDNCTALAEKGVTTLEKMESLMQHCRQTPHLQGKTLNLKNLVNGLPGWLQLQRKTTAAPSTGPVTSIIGKSTNQRLTELKEIQQRILEQDAKQEGPSLKPSERAAILARKKQKGKGPV
jgi:predicted transcriptional regulator